MTVPLRTTVLFFTAYALNTTAHEFAHALTAYSLGLRSTIFHYYTHVDFTGTEPSPRVLVAIAGPVFSLIFGLTCWLVYRKTRFKPSKLPWLYLAILGISIFSGNLFAASFTGDFGTAATILNVDPTIRLLVSILGLTLTCAFMYAMGQELVQWSPPGSSRTGAVIYMIAWPALLGTALVILAFLPLPAQFIAGWMATSLFWLFAAWGASLGSKSDGGDLRTRPVEYLAAAAALALVRILVAGVSLAP